MAGGRDTGDDERRAAESLAAIEAGGIPLPARDRLTELRGRDDRFFTSDLTVNEVVAVADAGFRPVAQVLGTCFYHVGYQWAPTWQAGGAYLGAPTGFPAFAQTWRQGETLELETASEAWNEARRLALGRLAEEAACVGAQAVVGVRLERGRYDWAAGLLEFVVQGTAVVSDRYELPMREGEPLLSNLSGQEFAMLVRSGWSPVGLVAGSTVCYVVSGWTQQARLGSGLFTSWQNQELTDFSRGLRDARSQAMLRVTRPAHELGAHGVVGVEVTHEEEPREADRGGVRYRDLVVTFHVVGTAVVELDRAQEDVPVYLALPLTAEGAT